MSALVERVAVALEAGNAHVASVLGEDSAGDTRVRVDPNSP